MDNIDQDVINNIKEYILENDISVKKLADEAGIAYHRLWSILKQNCSIKIGDYIAICKACNEPFDIFIPKN